MKLNKSFFLILALALLTGCASDLEYFYRNVSGKYSYEDVYNQCRYEEHLQNRADRRAGIDSGIPIHILLGKSSETEILCMKRFGWDYFSRQKDRSYELNQTAKIAFESNDFKTAFEKFSEAAKFGNAFSEFMLGAMYEEGAGTSQNYINAIYWYEKSAQQNYSDAAYNLGVIYEQGNSIIASDVYKSIIYYKQASRLRHAKSQYNLALIYRYGKSGVKVDLTESESLMKSAALLGSDPAMVQLGFASLQGEFGHEVSYLDAKRWFKLASEKKNSRALAGLSLLYMYGYGVEQDLVKSYTLYSLALKNGLIDTNNLGAYLKSKISSNELSQAKGQAELCEKRSYVGCD